MSVTKFTEKECQKLQKKATALILPKLGYNRMTKHALAYGPTSYVENKTISP